MVGVVVVVERLQRDRTAGARRVHEMPVTDVDAHVIDLAARDAEEHEVAALELALGDGARLRRLVARGARHIEPELAVREEHQTAAVEAIDRRATEAIWHAE